MRRVLLSRNRVDFVATLLQKGRLADMMMLQHFTAQHVENSSIKSAGEERNNDANVPVNGATRSMLLAKREAVRAKAMTAPWRAWLTEACGAAECYVLPQSQETVMAKITACDPTRVTLSGIFTMMVPEVSLPASVRLVASTEGGEAMTVTVAIAQSGDKVRSGNTIGGGFRTITLKEAEGTVVADVNMSVDAQTAERNVLAAAACSGILRKLEEICALHATHTTRYDALLVRNPAVQKRLSQLACARFGVDALNSFVVEAVAADEPLPLVESVALCMHAKSALAAGVENAREIIHGTAARQAVPHRSKPERLIDYAYVRELFESERYVMSSLDGSTLSQSMRYFKPLLAQPHVNTDVQNPLIAVLLGKEKGTVSLAAPHINLRVNTVALEKDIEALLRRIREQKKRSDPLFVMAMTQYVAEVFANVAVVYRATASLTREDENAPRDWLLAQAFCSESSARREMIFRDWDMSSAARRAVGKFADLSSCKTHPVELMNAEPVRKTKKTEVEEVQMKTAN